MYKNIHRCAHSVCVYIYICIHMCVCALCSLQHGLLRHCWMWRFSCDFGSCKVPPQGQPVYRLVTAQRWKGGTRCLCPSRRNRWMPRLRPHRRHRCHGSTWRSKDCRWPGTCLRQSVLTRSRSRRLCKGSRFRHLQSIPLQHRGMFHRLPVRRSSRSSRVRSPGRSTCPGPQLRQCRRLSAALARALL